MAAEVDEVSDIIVDEDESDIKTEVASAVWVDDVDSDIMEDEVEVVLQLADGPGSATTKSMTQLSRNVSTARDLVGRCLSGTSK